MKPTELLSMENICYRFKVNSHQKTFIYLYWHLMSSIRRQMSAEKGYICDDNFVAVCYKLCHFISFN